MSSSSSHSYRPPTHHSISHMYARHPSFSQQPSDPFAFPSPLRTTTAARRISTPDHRPKPEHPGSPMHLFSPPQRRASIPNTALSSSYDSRPDFLPTRRVDNTFPGPLRVPAAPRFLTSPPPSPHDSPPSTLVSPSQAFRWPSPPALLPSWRETGPVERLPPIRCLQPAFQDDLPQLSSARWYDDPYVSRPSPRFVDSPSPTPSSPEAYQDSPPRDSDSLPDSPPRFEYPSKYEYPNQRRDPRPYVPRQYDVDGDGYDNKNTVRSRRRYSPVQDAERQHASESSQRRGSLPSPPTARPYATSPPPPPPSRHHYPPRESPEHLDEPALLAGPSRAKTKFGVRRGSRFFCTYVSPLTGERCDTWDRGWTVYATLTRHAETEHAPEELALLGSGELRYDEAQIITSREKKERIEENLAQTGSCPDCGTMFSSKRRDSLSRHRQTSACEKAQKRARPPTKFPKKPKGPSFHTLEVDSTDDTP